MTGRTAPSGLSKLAVQLTDPDDRETYARLLSYFESLPPDDELFRLVELLGLLSLLGQRIPEALAELLAELRQQTKLSMDYQAQVEARLKNLSKEVLDGVDAGAIAKTIGESFRQQVTTTGLQDAAGLLQSSLRDIKALSNQVSANVKPLLGEYKNILTAVSTELAKLAAASKQWQQRNPGLPFEGHPSAWRWQALAALSLFLLGGVFGILLEKRQTTDSLASIYGQIERIQLSANPAAPRPVTPERPKRLAKIR